MKLFERNWSNVLCVVGMFYGRVLIKRNTDWVGTLVVE